MQARECELNHEVAALERGLGPGRRLVTMLAGSPFVYRAATRLRSLAGRGIEPEDELREAWLGVGALLWRARVARRLARVRSGAGARGGWSSIRASLTRLRALAVTSANGFEREDSAGPRGERAPVTAVIRGSGFSGRLAARLLARDLDGIAVVLMRRDDPLPALPPGCDVLFLDAGVRLDTPGWLGVMQDILLADPNLAAVAPTTFTGEGEAVDGAWEVAWELGAPRVRLAGSDSEDRNVPLLGGSCVLCRGEALEVAAEIRDGGRWSFDSCVALRERGWRLAVAPLSARCAPPRSDGETSPDLLVKRWGPVLRRRVLTDLVGGGDWSGRVAKVALDAGHDELEGWVAELGWERVRTPEDADFVLRFQGAGPDRALVAEWPGEPVCQARLPAPAGARELREGLLATIEMPSFCLEVGAPNAEVAKAGGDLHLAEALAEALRRRGHVAAVQDGSATGSVVAGSLDVRMHLRGRRRRRLNPGQLNVIWHMSHPEEVSRDELDEYDVALVASRPYSRTLASELDTPVIPFLQFTDPARFRPTPGPARASELLFVGNWRGKFRPSVWAALQCGHSVDLYGQGWRLLAPDHARADHVPNHELPGLYSSAEIVLCDHWPEMRELGFIANRVFDVLACEGFLLSDHFDALEEELGGCLATYRTTEELDHEIKLNLTDAGRRHAIARRGRAAVLREHTVDHRADQLVALVGSLGR